MVSSALPKGIRKRGTKFFVDVSRAGKRRTATCPSLEEAILKQRQLTAEIEADLNPELSTHYNQTFSVSKPLHSWTLRKAVDVTARLPAKEGWAGSKGETKTLINAEAVVAYFGPNKRLDEITEDDLDGFVAYLMEEKRNSNSTINKKMSCLSKLYRVAIRKKGASRKPLFPSRLGETQGRHRFISKDREEPAMLDALRSIGADDAADLVAVMIDTGCRYSEAVSIDHLDVSLARRVVLIHGRDAQGTKNNDFRSVPMTKRVIGILKERLKDGRTHPFQGLRYMDFYRSWNRAKAMIGLADDDKFTPHVCRHTCASRLVQNGVPIKVVQDWLGHKTITMTIRYAYLSPANLMGYVSALEDDE